MEHFEMVEKLREKANVSYEEARTALEASNWDILDAIILLEKQGKTEEKTARYNTRQENTSRDYQEQKNNGFGESANGFFKFIGGIIHKGNTNFFEVERNRERILSIPVTAFVLLLCFCFWIVIPLLIIALFCGYNIKFTGPQLGREDVNNVMDKASKAAESIKDEFKDINNNNKNG